MKQRAICPECIELLTHRFPTRNMRAVVVGLLHFFTVLKEEKPERCDECGMLSPVVFRYPAPSETSQGPCVHCGMPESDRAHEHTPTSTGSTHFFQGYGESRGPE